MTLLYMVPSCSFSFFPGRPSRVKRRRLMGVTLWHKPTPAGARQPGGQGAGHLGFQGNLKGWIFLGMVLDREWGRA